MAHLANRNWVIEFRDITLEEELGSGSFGMVYKVHTVYVLGENFQGIWRKQTVAVKQLVNETSSTFMLDFIKEINIMMCELILFFLNF